MLAAVSEFPIVPYIIPARSGCAMSAADLAVLHQSAPLLVPAVKQATGDLERMAEDRELFRLAVLAIALGVAAGSSYLFGVSLALGAFFAGMILSESELSDRAAQEKALNWAKEQQAKYAVAASVDEWRYKVGLDGEPAAGITLSITDLGSGQVDLVGPCYGQEGAHGGLVGEVQFGVGAGDDALRGVPLR